MRTPSRARRQRGFTLIEVMVATLVFLIGVVGFTGAITAASKFTHDARREMRATAVAQDLLEQLATWSIDDARLAPTTSGVCGSDPADSAEKLTDPASPEYADFKTCAHDESDLSSGNWAGLAQPKFVGGGGGDDTFERFWVVHEEDRDGNLVPAGGARKRIWAVVIYADGSATRRVVLETVRVRTSALGI